MLSHQASVSSASEFTHSLSWQPTQIFTCPCLVMLARNAVELSAVPVWYWSRILFLVTLLLQDFDQSNLRRVYDIKCSNCLRVTNLKNLKSEWKTIWGVIPLLALLIYYMKFAMRDRVSHADDTNIAKIPVYTTMSLIMKHNISKSFGSRRIESTLLFLLPAFSVRVTGADKSMPIYSISY